MSRKIAIYPGTFDPITKGHLDILIRACNLFDKVVILVAVNPQKSPLFTVKEREELIRGATKDLSNIEITSYRGLIVNYAEEYGGIAIIRGLRAISDFEFELQLALTNRRLNEKIHTIFMAPHERFTYLNSTIVKQVAKFKGDISHFVPENVKEALMEKFSSNIE